MWSRINSHATIITQTRDVFFAIFKGNRKNLHFLQLWAIFLNFILSPDCLKLQKRKFLFFFISTYFFFNNKLIISATFLYLTEMKFDLVVFLHFKIIFISRTPFYQIILVLLSLIKQNYNCIVKSVFLILSKTFRTLIYL